MAAIFLGLDVLKKCLGIAEVPVNISGGLAYHGLNWSAQSGIVRNEYNNFIQH